MSRSILILYNMQNGYMDPGFPGFIFSENGSSDSETNPNTNIRGVLKMIPLMKCIANKMDGIVFLDDTNLKNNSKGNRVYSLDRVPGEKLLSIKNITKDDRVFFGGVIDKDDLQFKIMLKIQTSITLIEEITFTFDESLRERFSNRLSLVDSDSATTNQNLIKFLRPS